MFLIILLGHLAEKIQTRYCAQRVSAQRVPKLQGRLLDEERGDGDGGGVRWL